MRKLLLLISVVMTSVVAMAQNTPVIVSPDGSASTQKQAPRKVTLPIIYDEVIDEQPEGTVVDNCVRSGYSYYYTEGSLWGGYNDAFTGEYVIGNDGCIYLKDVCASVPLGTYLKLEKVEGTEDQYVAHTAQLIWVYETSTSPYLYFATRLVFHQYSETSYGYVVEEDAEGKAVTDVFFTFKDGVLKQNNQETVTMNGVTYPAELIGFTNSTGGWIGYGDACITIAPQTESAVTLPEGAEVKEMSMAFNVMSSTTGESVRNARLIQYAEVDNDYYLLNPLDGKNWIKGSIDREANTVTFKKQYAGIYEDIDCHEWMIPATYNVWKDVWDEEEDYGEWVRDFKETDALVFTYDNGSLISDANQKEAFTFSRSKESIELSAAYADVLVKPYVDQLAKPATPRVLKLEPVELTYFWGELVFALPPVDANEVYINKKELSYVVYFNNETTPFVFNTDDHWGLDSDQSEFPYGFTDDMDFFNNGGGAFHNIYFYEAGVKYAGVQTIHRKDGQEMRSEIGWINHETATGITDVNANETGVKGKWLEDGKIVIINGTQKYNTNGQRLN